MIIFDDLRSSIEYNEANIKIILPYVLATFKEEQARDIKFQEIYRAANEQLREILIEMRPKAAEDMVYLEIREQFMLSKEEWKIEQL